MQEEYIIQRVMEWMYEDLVNDILELRTNIIIAQNGEPYYYPLNIHSVAYADNPIERFRKNSVNAKKRYDKINFYKGRRTENNAENIVYSTLATLINLIDKQQKLPHVMTKNQLRISIKKYFKDCQIINTEKLKSIYEHYSNLSNDRRLDLLYSTEKMSQIIEQLHKCIPVEKILTMYLYFEYHTSYWEQVYNAFELMVSPMALSSDSYVAMLTNMKGKISSVQERLMSESNLSDWRNEFFADAMEAAVYYPIITELIPKISSISKKIKGIFKKWNDIEKNKGKFQTSNISIYEENIKDMLSKELMIPINRKGYSNKYSCSENEDSVTLDTLNNSILPNLQNELGFFYSGKGKTYYFYPELKNKDVGIQEFVRLCELYHKEKLFLKSGKTAYEVITNKEIIKILAKLFVFLFLMYAFGSDWQKSSETQETFVDYINRVLKKNDAQVILMCYQCLVNNKIISDYPIFLRIIKQILKGRN